MPEVTEEDIEKYIELDNKIKDRIIEISNALCGISNRYLEPYLSFKPEFSNFVHQKVLFLENSNTKKCLLLGLDPVVKDDHSIQFDKNLLSLTDRELTEVREGAIADRTKAMAEASAKQEKEIEDYEYKEYLRLKCKFENGGKHYTVRSSNAESTKVPL